MPRSETFCRYFANGICTKGNSCAFVHDDEMRNENVCHFYRAGKCSFGTSCRFLHVKPRNADNSTPSKQQNSSSSSPGSSTSSSPSTASSSSAPSGSISTGRVRPVQLPKPQTFNVEAVEFIPSWKIKQEGNPFSYASAVASSSSSTQPCSSSFQSSAPSYKHTQMALCPYYQKNGECTRKDSDCIFAHGDKCDMCNTWSLHPFSEEKKREHQKECLDHHHREMERAFMEQRSETKTCGICMENIAEKNLRFGILNGCQHCFCLECIRQWRTRSQEVTSELATKTVRSCPECRQHSDYVIPSVMWVEAGQEKDLLIEMYKEGMKMKVCKYYSNATQRGNCPFGNKCFYKHQLPDGSIDPGESPHVRRRARLSDFIFDHVDGDDIEQELLDNLLRRLLDPSESPDSIDRVANMLRHMYDDDE